MNVPTKHAAAVRQLQELGAASPEQRRNAETAHEAATAGPTDGGEGAGRRGVAGGQRQPSTIPALPPATQRALASSGASPVAVLASLGGSERGRAAVRRVHEALFDTARSTVLQRRRDASGAELNNVLRALLSSFKDDARLTAQRAARGVPSVMVPSLDDVIQLLSDERFEVAKTTQGDFQEHMGKRMQWLIEQLGHARETGEVWEQQYKLLLVEFSAAEETTHAALRRQREAEEHLREALATLSRERAAGQKATADLNRQISQLREKLYETLEAQAGISGTMTSGSAGATTPPARLPPVRDAGGSLGRKLQEQHSRKACSSTRLGSSLRTIGGRSLASTTTLAAENDAEDSSTASACEAAAVEGAEGLGFSEKERLLRQLAAARNEAAELRRAVSILEDKVIVAQQETVEQERCTAETQRMGELEAANLKAIVTQMRDAHVQQLESLEAEAAAQRQQQRAHERTIQDLQQQLRESAVRMLSLQQTLLTGPSMQTLLFEAVTGDAAEDVRESVEELAERIAGFANKFDELRGAELPGALAASKSTVAAHQSELRELEANLEADGPDSSGVCVRPAGSPLLRRKSTRRLLRRHSTASALCAAAPGVPPPELRDAATETDAPCALTAAAVPLGAAPAGEEPGPWEPGSAAAAAAADDDDDDDAADTTSGSSSSSPPAVVAAAGQSPLLPAAEELRAPSPADAAAPPTVAPPSRNAGAAASPRSHRANSPAAAPAARPKRQQAGPAAVAGRPAASSPSSPSSPQGSRGPSRTSSTVALRQSSGRRSSPTPTAAPRPAGKKETTAAARSDSHMGPVDGALVTAEAAEMRRAQSVLERERRQRAVAAALSASEPPGGAPLEAEQEALLRLQTARADATATADRLRAATERIEVLDAENRTLQGRVTTLEGQLRESTASTTTQQSRLHKQLAAEKEKAVKATEKYNQQFLAYAQLQDELEQQKAAHAEEVEGLHELLVALRHEIQQLSNAEQRLHFINKERRFSETCERVIRCLQSGEATLACPSCLELVENPLVCFPCGHVVCERCFLRHQQDRGVSMPSELEAASLQLSAFHSRVATFDRQLAPAGPRPQLPAAPLIAKASLRALHGHPLHCEECGSTSVVGFTRVPKLHEVGRKFAYLLRCSSEFKDVMMQSLASDTHEALKHADVASGRPPRQSCASITLGDSSQKPLNVKGVSVDLELPPSHFIDDSP